MGRFFYDFIPVGWCLYLYIILNVNKDKREIMNERINMLVDCLNLNAYQAHKLKTNYDKYNISGMQKRGGVLYVPYMSHGLFGAIRAFLFGAPADLIGQNKVLLRAQRNIKFCENGFHCVRVGRYTYYANAAGQVVSKEEFLAATKN